MVVPSEEVVSNDHLVVGELDSRVEGGINADGEVTEGNISGGGSKDSVDLVLHFGHHIVDLVLNLIVDHVDEVIDNLLENAGHVSFSVRNLEVIDAHVGNL